MKENNTTSILHLICGLPGSGKTTLAKKIELTQNAIRFCPDEWIKDIWTSESEGSKNRDSIEQLQWKMGKKILQSGVDIIIEWGTWGKSERDFLKTEAWAIGSKVKFYYLDVPKNILKERILNRNKKLGEHEMIMPEKTLDKELDRCFKLFQKPNAEELNNYDFLG